MATLEDESITTPLPESSQVASSGPTLTGDVISSPVREPEPGYGEYSQADYLRESGNNSIAAAIEAGVAPEDVKDESWAFFERLGDGISAAASSPEAFLTAAISAADNVLPLPFDAASAVLNMAGVDVDQLKANNPEAAKAGATVGLVVGLVGGPAKLASMVVKGAAKKGYKFAKGGDRGVSLKRLSKVRDELKTILNSNKVLVRAGQKASKELKDVDKLAAELTKKFNRKSDPVRIREDANDFISKLPGTHILKQFPDLMGTIVDTAVSTGRIGTGGFGSNIKEQFIHNLANATANIGPVIGGMVSDFGTDWAFNFIYAYNNATKIQGLSSSDSATLALAFANERAPEDVATSVIGVLGKGHPLTALLAPSIKTVLVSEDVRGGEIVDHSKSDASGWQAESDKFISQYNQGGPINPMRAKFYNKGGMTEAEGWAAESKKYADANLDVGSMSPKEIANVILDNTPIIGDIRGAIEVAEMIKAGPKSKAEWALIGALAGAAIIGLVPGIGDAAAAAIKAGAKAGLKGVKGGVELAKRIEVDPNVVGSNFGNIRLKAREDAVDEFGTTEAFERSMDRADEDALNALLAPDAHPSTGRDYTPESLQAKLDDPRHSDQWFNDMSFNTPIDEFEATSLYAQSKDRSVGGGRYPDFKETKADHRNTDAEAVALTKDGKEVIADNLMGSAMGRSGALSGISKKDYHRTLQVDGSPYRVSPNIKKALSELPENTQKQIIEKASTQVDEIANKNSNLDEVDLNIMFSDRVHNFVDTIRKKKYDKSKDEYYGIRQVDEFVDADGKSWPITGNPDAMSGDLPDVGGQDLLPFEAQDRLKMRKQELGEVEAGESWDSFDVSQQDWKDKQQIEKHGDSKQLAEEYGGIFSKNLADEEAAGITKSKAEVDKIISKFPHREKLRANDLHFHYDKVSGSLSPEEFIDKMRSNGNQFTEKQAAKFIELRNDPEAVAKFKAKQNQQASDRSAAAANRKTATFNMGGILSMNKGGNVYKRKRGIICG